MPNNWKIYKLTELGTVARGKSKHRPRDAAHLYGGEYPFIQTGDVKAAGHRLFKHSQTYSEAGLAQSKLWPKNTMCITIAANIAETSIIDYPACFPDSIIGFIANEELCNVEFVEYLMQHFKKQIQSHSIGSVQDNINLGTFNRVEFLVPPLPEQHQIAAILTAIDNKIELNLQQNRTLEEMARALYKHWFVDFGPFQNGEFVESELGKIPKDWEVKRLEDFATIKGGKRLPKGFQLTNQKNEHPYIRVRDFNSVFLNKVNMEYVPDEAFKLISNYIVNDSDVVLTIVGTVGKTALIRADLENASLTENCVKICLSGVVTSELVFLQLNSKVGQEEIKSKTVGSTQPKLPIYNIKQLKIVVPTKFEIVNDVLNELKLFYSNIYNNTQENQTLSQLRDTLLPKLISGEVRVKDLKETVSQLL